MSALEQGRTDAEGPPGAVDVNVYRTSAERAASGEAPLKKEFLKPVWVMPRKRNRDEKVLATSTTDPKATRTSEEAGDATVAGQSEAAPAGAPDNTSDVVMAEPEGTAAGGDAQVPTGALRGAEKPQKLSKGRYTKTARKKRAQELRESSFQESGLCPTVAREGPDSCRFGEKCRYSHDLAAYIAQRPPDLPITPCPQFAALGSCGSGVKCRCGSSHIKDGRNVVDEEKQAHAAENRAMNALPKDLQRQLRRREFPFKRSLEVVPKYNNGKRMSFVTKAQERRRMKNIRRAERKAAAAAAAGEEAPSVTSTADGDETPAEEAPQESKGQTDCAAASAMDVESTTAVPVAEASSPADVDVTKNSAADVIAKLRPAEKKKVDFVDKLVLAPLTTIGNLPFRRICKGFGADITIGEMAMATSLLQGQNMEWALLKRHPCEDVFGVQLAGGYCDTLAASCELINEHASVDFVDLNCGCPIDLVCYKGAGCSLPTHRNKFEGVCRSMAEVLDVPLTVKMRVGYSNGSPTAHKIFPDMASWGVSALTVCTHFPPSHIPLLSYLFSLSVIIFIYRKLLTPRSCTAVLENRDILARVTGTTLASVLA